MKKLLLLSLMAFMILFQFNIDAYASYSPVEGDITVDDLPDNEFDEQGHVVKGSWCMKLSGSWSSVDIQNPYDNIEYLYVLKRTYTSGNYSADYYVAGKRKVGSSPLLYKSVVIDNSSLSADSDFKVIIENALNNDSPRAITGDYGVSNSVWANGGWFVTNIPVFDVNDTVGLQNYIDNGDISSALNKNDVYTPPTVPAPTNIKMSSASKTDSSSKFSAPIVVSWEANQNENFNWETMRFKVQYRISYGYMYGTLESSNVTELKTVANHVKYRSGSTNYTISEDTLNKQLTVSIAGLDFNIKSHWIKNVVVYITNEQSSDTSNVSETKYLQYDYISKVTDTDSTTEEESSTEGGSDSENGSDGVGDGTQNGTQYNGNGVTVNVTQNNNGSGGSSSIWSVVATALAIFLDSISDSVGGVTDGIVSFLNGLTSLLTGGNNLLGIPQLLNNLIDSLVNLFGGSDGEGGYTGLFGTINGLTETIGGLISNVLSPFTESIASLMESITGLLDASSEFGQYITSGFGLLGENGYLAMFGAFFQFVPEEIWTMIKLGVASSCSVLLSGSVVKLLRR